MRQIGENVRDQPVQLAAADRRLKGLNLSPRKQFFLVEITKLWEFESKQQTDFNVFIQLDFRFCLFSQYISAVLNNVLKSLYLICSLEFQSNSRGFLPIFRQSLNICVFLLFENTCTFYYLIGKYLRILSLFIQISNEFLFIFYTSFSVFSAFKSPNNNSFTPYTQQIVLHRKNVIFFGVRFKYRSKDP